MKKITLILSILTLSLNADGLSRFIDVKAYKNFSEYDKKAYLRGSIDMLRVQINNRFGKDNKISICMDKINNINTYLEIYDNFLNHVEKKYDNFSASEILTIPLVEHCKK